MDIRVDTSGTVKALASLVGESLTAGAQSLLVLSCDKNGFSPDKLDAFLHNIQVPIFGGIFPAVFHQTEKIETGTIVLGIQRPLNVHVLRDLSENSTDIEDDLNGIDRQMPTTQTMFVFVDGFMQRINRLIETLFNIFGLEKNYVGGGAGSLSMVQKPCVISNQGLLQDSAVLAFTDMRSSIGVGHGWRSIEGPFQVTESNNTIIETLDWKPAFDVYKEVVEKHAGSSINPDNFFDIAKAYPFGIARLTDENIVRDPIMVEEHGRIVCVGEVPTGALVDVLHGDDSSLLNAAKSAFERSERGFDPSITQRTALFIDCISRVLFLQDRFLEELSEVNPNQEPLIGAATIGEIANTGNNYLEFYNKTAVVGLLESQ